MSTILFVVTGATHWKLNDGTWHPTGYWTEELLTPYKTFTDAGHEVVFATPGGVVPTADPASLAPSVNGARDVAPELSEIAGLMTPLKLEEVDLAGYHAVFYPGGHGPMEDLAVDVTSGRLLVKALESGKPLGVVCHAPAALLEDRLKAVGADVRVAAPWTPNVVIDGNLITGQNPMSSGPPAAELLTRLG